MGKSLRGKKGGLHWETLVHYIMQNLMEYLESLFEPWMNWKNYGSEIGRWSVDHIVPISSFCFSSYKDEEFHKCWALDNLRALWFWENRSKRFNIKEVTK